MSESHCITAALTGYIAAGLALPTQYEGYGMPELEDETAAWASVFWLPVDIDSRLQTVDKDVGLLQIDLNYPPKQGWAEVSVRSGSAQKPLLAGAGIQLQRPEHHGTGARALTDPRCRGWLAAHLGHREVRGGRG